jgi:methylmalonyl-CoA carboxyltransferase large subunit
MAIRKRATVASLAETLEALRLDVAILNERLAALEGAGASPRAAAAPTRISPEAPKDLSEEVVAAISAAIAAYLGVKPHIRQITLVGGATWAQQGRVTIQASHALGLRRD